jgi:hypothetical protein
MASVQDREKQKKRPLSGPPFFKEAKWRESEETSLTPLWETGTDRVRVENIESEVFQTGAASSVVM